MATALALNMALVQPAESVSTEQLLFLDVSKRSRLLVFGSAGWTCYTVIHMTVRLIPCHHYTGAAQDYPVYVQCILWLHN
jgi:hypothetical protein